MYEGNIAREAVISFLNSNIMFDENSAVIFSNNNAEHGGACSPIVIHWLDLMETQQ